MSSPKKEIYDCWAPMDARWSRWVKPVLFASADDVFTYLLPRPPLWTVDDLFAAVRSTPVATSPYRVPNESNDLAVVIDLPGTESLVAGIALVDLGFRPVPLYNAVPAADAVVEMRPLAEMLASPPAALRRLSPEAPPAFLLDHRRRGEGALLQPAILDNRSTCSLADFPSADTLRAAGLSRVLVVQPGTHVAVDLQPTLQAWQTGDLTVSFFQTSSPQISVPQLIVQRTFFERVLHGFLAPIFDPPSAS
jgi:hypothetical protein